MKKALLTAASLVVLGMAPALAADLPAQGYSKSPAMIAAVYDWSGVYLGINGGGASSRNCWDLNNVAGTPIVPAVREGCTNASGGLVGGQMGYRWQSAGWVFGLEFQGDWANLSGSGLSSPVALTSVATNSTKVDALGLATGQVGYAWNSVLWYVKGGAAVAHNKYTGSLTASGAVFDQASDTRWGAAVGTGFEVIVAPNWSVGVEYDHLFMGSRNVFFPATAAANTRNDNISQDVDMGTVRINYRFGGPVVAKY